MKELPDLDRLSHADKDELILALFAQVQALTKQVETLTARVVELEGRLAKNSRNSNKPPSSDRLNRPKPKCARHHIADLDRLPSQPGQEGVRRFRHSGRVRRYPDPRRLEALP
ncbi:MAG: DUF6444 domain-containing protein [Sulfurisoma sp.]|nr:DUF6444 domain-containing protein [Sulfurisoma sp.]